MTFQGPLLEKARRISGQANEMLVLSIDNSNPNIKVNVSKLMISPYQRMQTSRFSFTINGESGGYITNLRNAIPIGVTIQLTGCDLNNYSSPLPQLRLYRKRDDNTGTEIPVLNYTDIKSLSNKVTIHGTSSTLGSTANNLSYNSVEYDNPVNSLNSLLYYNITSQHTLSEYNKIRIASTFNGVLNIKLLLII